METDINLTNTSQPLPQTNQIPNQPIVEPQYNKSVKALFYVIGVILFMAIGALGYKLYESGNLAQQFNGVKVTPTITQDAIINSPTLSDTKPSSELTPTPKPPKSVVTTPSAKFAPYFEKLIINVKDGNKLENYYTASWFWCAFSNGTRILDSSYNQYIDVVGTNSQGKDVYILNKSAPYPKDQHILSSIKKTMEYEGENGKLVTQEEWTSFLNNQKIDYPVVIIKDPSNELIEYIRQDYLYLPGC